jgi:hypothetical protein
MTTKTELSPSYFECARLTRELHALIREGKCDSDEAEAIRDDMDEPYYRLEPLEIERLRRLSADLNSLTKPFPDIEMASEHEGIVTCVDELARESDPERIRSFLMSDRQDDKIAAFARFKYWIALNDEESARLFAKQLAGLIERDLAQIREDVRAIALDIERSRPETSSSDFRQWTAAANENARRIQEIGFIETMQRMLREKLEAEPAGMSDLPSQTGDLVDPDFEISLRNLIVAFSSFRPAA